MERYRQQLKKQLRFIVNSCRYFDNGDMDEAIRIATCIRVLLHDTKSSTSLLTHLNAKSIKLFCTDLDIPEEEEGHQYIVPFSMGVISCCKDDFGYKPNLEDYTPGVSRVLPAVEWWDKVIWKPSFNCQLSRKTLILSAANQDGGAHVDSHLNINYEQLSRYQAGTMTLKIGNKTHTVDVVNMHLVSIRTIANEILKSPELIQLIS